MQATFASVAGTAQDGASRGDSDRSPHRWAETIAFPSYTCFQCYFAAMNTCRGICSFAVCKLACLLAEGSAALTPQTAGIGLGIARAFLENGDKVVMVSRSIEKVQGEEDDIQRYVNSGQAQLLTADLRQVRTPQAALREPLLAPTCI